MDFVYDSLLTWGNNEECQLSHGGNQKKHSAFNVPSRVRAAQGLGCMQLGMSASHVVMTTRTDHAYSCGANESGQLGKGDSKSRAVLRLIHGLCSVRVLQAACGQRHTLFLSDDGVYATGSNSNGQLGLGELFDSKQCRVPLRVSLLDDDSVVQVACGAACSAAVLADGTLKTWGAPALLGREASDDVKRPCAVDVLDNVRRVAFGQNHALALLASAGSDARVASWGDNMHGQLGHGDTQRRTLPLVIAELRDAAFVAVGSYHSAVVDSGGVLWMFGSNMHGQLGVGAELEAASVPRALPKAAFGGASVLRVACGRLHSLALTGAATNQVYAFGFNKDSQLGLGHTSNQHVPQRIDALRDVVVRDIAAGGLSSAAVVQEVARGGGGGDGGNGERLNVLAGTWNVNANVLESLGDWLLCDSPPDIVAVGLQEIVELSATNVTRSTAGSARAKAKSKVRNFFGKSSASGGDESVTAEQSDNDASLGATGLRWRDVVVSQLVAAYGRDQYSVVACKRLVGVWMVVLVRASVASRVSNVAAVSTSVGLLNRVGNKGAVAVRFELDALTRFCFVCSHLAAGVDADALEKRQIDYLDLCQGLEFEEYGSIFDHERLLWCGDLNFRVSGMQRDDVVAAAEADQLELLWQHDELRAAKERGRVFYGWHEEKIAFRPTYKYDLQSDTYDTSAKARPPSWCDRVLVRGNGWTVKRYARHELKTSDHRPVSFVAECALLDAHARPAVPPKQKAERTRPKTLPVVPPKEANKAQRPKSMSLVDAKVPPKLPPKNK